MERSETKFAANRRSPCRRPVLQEKRQALPKRFRSVASLSRSNVFCPNNLRKEVNVNNLLKSAFADYK